MKILIFANIADGISGVKKYYENIINILNKHHEIHFFNYNSL